MEEKNFLDVKWSVWDYITMPFYRVKVAVSDAIFNLKMRVQRFLRGYSQNDVWNMYYWFIDNARPMLMTLLREHHGYPCGMTNEEYEQKLSEMIRLLDLMDEDKADEYLGVPCGGESSYAFMEESKNQFFILFSELFYNLWD
ncbi:MAG: hypothetical protein J6Y20_07745 [Lachnospiraceae bacterium]|nr:hypothetical protein [Lachnospiraceae bacterium]